MFSKGNLIRTPNKYNDQRFLFTAITGFTYSNCSFLFNISGIPGERLNVTMECTEGSRVYTRVGHITPMKDCECNVCVGGGQKEEETGKKTIFMLLFYICFCVMLP